MMQQLMNLMVPCPSCRQNFVGTQIKFCAACGGRNWKFEEKALICAEGRKLLEVIVEECGEKAHERVKELIGIWVNRPSRKVFCRYCGAGIYRKSAALDLGEERDEASLWD